MSFNGSAISVVQCLEFLSKFNLDSVLALLVFEHFPRHFLTRSSIGMNMGTILLFFSIEVSNHLGVVGSLHAKGETFSMAKVSD